MEGLQDWVEGLPEALQWLGVAALSAVPWLESYSGPFFGIIAGMPWWAALASAVLGNAAVVAALIYMTHGLRSAALSRENPEEITERKRKRREKIQRLLDKYGVPGVSVLGPFALPSQITAPVMVSFGANRHKVMVWMLISIILWGLLSVILTFWLLSVMS
ncbi:small multi-drug export protein [Nesterenkonia populi]